MIIPECVWGEQPRPCLDNCAYKYLPIQPPRHTLQIIMEIVPTSVRGNMEHYVMPGGHERIRQEKRGVSRTDSDTPIAQWVGKPLEPAPGGKDDKVKRSLMSLISPGKHISSARPGHGEVQPSNKGYLHPLCLPTDWNLQFQQLL